MKRLTCKAWLTKLLAVIIAVIVMGCSDTDDAGKKEPSDKFEMIRTHIQAWLSEAGTDKPSISSSYLKEKIVDDWSNQKGKYLIVSVRKADDYNNAGHIPNAMNIYWRDIVKDESLDLLDSTKTLIIYCYYGHASMLSYTIFSLLGYRCDNLDFGMMDWNLDALVKEPWHQEVAYDVETTANASKEMYSPPIIVSELGDAKDIIKERERKYFGDASPVIPSSDVKSIVDDWDQKKIEYQIVSVRSKKDYEKGHVSHSINIPWTEIARIENLKKLDPNRTIIVYSDTGQTGQLSVTVLNLLGYNAVNMKFGMVDWNMEYVDRSKQWDGVADYPIEFGNQISPQDLNSQ